MMKQENAQKCEVRELKKTLMDREAKDLAGDFYRRLQEEGLESRDVLNVTTQLLGIATDAMANDNQIARH